MNRKSKIIVAVFSIIFLLMLLLFIVDRTPDTDTISDRFEALGYKSFTIKYKGKTQMFVYKSGDNIKFARITWYDSREEAADARNDAVKLAEKNCVAIRGSAVAVGSESCINFFKIIF